MNKSATVLTITILLLISTISASCDKGQIDINTASKEELKKLDGIGDGLAQRIIDFRDEKLFSSIDELIEVPYIGNITLDKIKEQELACVNGQEEEPIEEAEEDKETTKEEIIVEERQEMEELQEIAEPVSREIEPIELQTINLNPKVIKSEDDNENLSKSNYAIYGLVFFCVLLVVLFIFRKNKYNKNEFR